MFLKFASFHRLTRLIGEAASGCPWLLPAGVMVTTGAATPPLVVLTALIDSELVNCASYQAAHLFLVRYIAHSESFLPSQIVHSTVVINVAIGTA